MGAKKETDRRIQKTRRSLRDALISLLLERGWDALSVQDICERADIGRSTFYMHFADKEELLISGFDDLRKMLRESAPLGDSQGTLGFVRGMIEHAKEHERLFRALIGKRSGVVVQKRFRQVVLGLLQEDLSGLPLLQPIDAVAHYLTGAFVELLLWWLESRSNLSASELAALFHQLARPSLQAAQNKTPS